MLQNSRLEDVKQQEREMLEAQSVPLRNYLMKYVMPTLIEGLNECCKVRPDDPVDYMVRSHRWSPSLRYILVVKEGTGKDLDMGHELYLLL